MNRVSETPVSIPKPYFPFWMLCGLALVSLAGCQKAGAVGPPPPPPLPKVDTVHPRIQLVTEFEEFSGRTWSPQTVEVRARVTGYLTKVEFEDGDDVVAKETLFRIDDRTYKADLDKAEAEVQRAIAQHQELKGRYDRAKTLLAKRSISTEEFETLGSQTASAEAAIASANAARDLAQFHLDFTKVGSPISGRIGRRLVDEGNLVKEDDTILATVVSLNPIHAYFDFDERTVLKMRRIAEQKLRLSAAEGESSNSVLRRKAARPVTVDPASPGGSHTERSEPPPDSSLANEIFMKQITAGLAGDQGFPLTGMINWVDNQIDIGTGTLRARAELQNDDLLLSPGMFIRLKVPVGEPEERLLVPEEALGSNQGLRFVYVVDDEKIVRERPVEIGWLEGKQRVILSGLNTSDEVVVTGLQRIRAKMKVEAKLRDFGQDRPATDPPSDEKANGSPSSKNSTAPSSR